MKSVLSLLTWRPFFMSSPSYYFLSLVIAALSYLCLINFSRIKKSKMQNANTPASINIQPSDLALIARALRKEKDYCERMKHECRSLQMDQEEINYWHQQQNKCSDIINRINGEL